MMTRPLCLLTLSCVLCLMAAPAFAKIDLVTLPGRDGVQLTIYNSADLTLVRDTRTLTLKRGTNRLQFSWVGTLIDPTSLEMQPLARAGETLIDSLSYPPRTTGLGVWSLSAPAAGPAPFQISYFTSGISWQAYYLATLSNDEGHLRLEGYVRLNNRSGEDYPQAVTRLVVGKIHLIDSIAELARRRVPYGRPGGEPPPTPAPRLSGVRLEADASVAKAVFQLAPKEIVKEGLSEYFLYTIEGTEDISDGWGKRLISFTAPRVPVQNLYRFEEERYGSLPVRFLSFANDAAHQLGREPLPGGLVKVFRSLDGDGHLSYLGAEEVRYVPKGDEVALNLGPALDVTVQPTLLEVQTDGYEWRNEQITGWDEVQEVRIVAANHREVPAKVEIRRSFPVTSWELKNSGNAGTFSTIDKNTVQYMLELAPGARQSFSYRVTLHHGSRAR